MAKPRNQVENEILFNQAPPVESKQRFFGAETNDEDQSLVLPSNIAEEAKMKKKFAPDGFNQNQHSNNMLFTGETGLMIDDFQPSLHHDETASNLIATVGGGNLSPLVGLTQRKQNLREGQSRALLVDLQPEEDNEDLAMMWPS